MIETNATDTVATQFQELAEQWRNETAHLSLALKQVAHPTYQRIIGLGPVAVPLILHELQREPDHWFAALEAITGENPVATDSNIAQATQAWLQWGIERNIIDEDEAVTLEQAAELLHVSTPYLVKKLEAGEIPFHRVGTQRRIPLPVLVAYQQQRYERTQKILRQMREEAETLRLYE